MTTRHDFSGGTIEQLLFDAGHSDAVELRAALTALASLGQLAVPAPGPELAAMLAGPHNDLTRQRWLRKHRPAVIGLAVLAGMGLGVSGVAATSPRPGEGQGLRSVQQLTLDWTPGWSIAGVPVVPTAGEPQESATGAASDAGDPGLPASGSAAPAKLEGGEYSVPVTPEPAPALEEHGRGPASDPGDAGKSSDGQHSGSGNASQGGSSKPVGLDPAGESGGGDILGSGATLKKLHLPATEKTRTVSGSSASAVDSLNSWLGNFRP
ncbi:hypothetical protein [Arthrobacter sp. 92]|jgi:hypothetical protein|uniref:hypothetical protein n=1 Tax=Arthrobacter sp. 92 TaxID=3418175 RepID=UPI003CFEAE48